jgi:hypothetical protein
MSFGQGRTVENNQKPGQCSRRRVNDKKKKRTENFKEWEPISGTQGDK